ncbi:unnamed protein product [Clonostachys rhizophaga]|uniref:Hemerythrin-like domain-containing protein n=1 Tax=Clonostachys rhizophaga TaxID=160324 RepID=A0A9N9UXL1_9HYPO|nr:unnamed protein product [Clonostachys rhizophaga]
MLTLIIPLILSRHLRTRYLLKPRDGMCSQHDHSWPELNIPQSQHAQPSDHHAFCNYANQWYQYLHVHYSGEEKHYFPAIERLSRQGGLMSRNVDQHKAFQDGVEEFSLYVQGCLNENPDFRGNELIRIIDAFSEALIGHLNGEIETMLGLPEVGEERTAEILDIHAQAVGGVLVRTCNMPIDEQHLLIASPYNRKQGMVTRLPFAISNLDLHYDGGIRAKTFPPPEAAEPLFVIRHIGLWFHRDWWKFASCDRLGNLQPLYAVPKKSKHYRSG